MHISHSSHSIPHPSQTHWSKSISISKKSTTLSLALEVNLLVELSRVDREVGFGDRFCVIFSVAEAHHGFDAHVIVHLHA
jgi:hypothetical protein